MMHLFSILVVGNDLNDFKEIQTLLSDQGYRLHHANAQQATASLETLQIDLILLDASLSGVDGAEMCRCIRAMAGCEALPIVAATPLIEEKVSAQLLEAGADDVINQPINRLELVARVRSMLRIRHQYQQLIGFNDRLEATVRQRTAKLQTMVFQDSLTLLPSRTALLQTVTERSFPTSVGTLREGGASQHEASSFALVYLDCDQFNRVNGSFGYAVGDQLLVKIAERLQQHLRPGDLLARTGEDEFCFLLDKIDDVSVVETFVQLLLRSFRQPFSVAHCDIFMTVCLGIAFSRDAKQSVAQYSVKGRGVDRARVDKVRVDSGLVSDTDWSYWSDSRLSKKQRSEKILRAADTAMYQAKLRGRGCYQFFDPQMYADILSRLTLESDLQRALDQQSFTLHYQPIVELKSQAITGFEALVRWRHPTRGMVSPAEFIPCMEASGLIVRLGMQVLEQACHQLYRWQQRGYSVQTKSENLSVRQFACPMLLADVDRILAQTRIDPGALKLEITESAIMGNAEMAVILIEELRSRGIQISIDDFGTGYSSLGYLHRFPVDNLKIDRSFVQMLSGGHGSGAPIGNRDYHVVDTIVALSQQLNLSVIAEGIETQQQLLWLQQLGCQFGQGYFFSKPMAAADIEKTHLLKAFTPQDRVAV